MAKLRLNDYINVILDPAAAQGIRRIGAKVATDVEATTGAKSQVILPDTVPGLPQAILVAELGHDALAETLMERLPELEKLKGRWESYGFFLIEKPLPNVEEGLVIVGSDRIGTIYGMFHLSELLGVTAWGFWGDAAPPAARGVILTDSELNEGGTSAQRKNSGTGHGFAKADITGTGQGLEEKSASRYEQSLTDGRDALSGKEVRDTASGMDSFAHTYPRDVYSWGEKRQRPILPTETIYVKNGISKEPSVRYRGFFINDEWPCFGNWTFSHYQGFTAEMYDKVFEYLLRMKGNYLWPAMWSSSFLLDGPGLASMELATEYGIYIGMSHHEPCMRSGAEFSIFKGEHSPYGNDWSYVTNKEGLLKFWEDGLARVRGQNVFPTIGMRGENDSKMLGDDSTIEENVRLLKEIITEQRKLIAKHINPDLKKVPQLLAIYKEVEDYFFGNEEASGLSDFEELDDVTLMFCEDNFNNMRALPQEMAQYAFDPSKDRDRLPAHPGGYGMYYHVDYHGSPISYEWVNSTPITKIWEQMTEAWEYGIREVWILNVGDVKFNEYPLGYFLSLAYDFDTYGLDGLDNTLAYTEEWIRSLFGKLVDEEKVSEITWVLKESVDLHSLRRAEALNDTIYHPVHYGEAKQMLQRAESLEKRNEELYASLKGSLGADGYYSMIYFPAAGIANLLKMHLASGLNHLYSAQGKAVANQYGEMLEACILRDRALAKELAAFRDGKWSGMEREEHIGFVNWNDEDYRYPVRHMLTLPDHPRLVVSRADRTKTFTNQYFPVPLTIRDFENAGTDQVTLQVANGGCGTVDWQIVGESECFEITPSCGSTALQTEVTVRVLRERIPAHETVEFRCQVRAGRECVPLLITARNPELDGIPKGAFLVQEGICVWDAAEFVDSTPGMAEEEMCTGKNACGIPDGEKHVSEAAAAFQMLRDYGKYGSGMKVFPTTAVFDENDWKQGLAPSLSYEIWTPEAGAYRLSLHTSPANPLVYGGMLRYGISVNGEAPRMVAVTSDGYRGGDPGCAVWCEAVLNQEHVAEVPVSLREGLNRITVYAGDAGIVLERLTLEQDGTRILKSYLGAPVSYRV
ncbi:MAG: glycosyl hydrolase 115 family protein [Clostridiales bacterium]|nr:glycosyl hydrolase 115 family protein [Clostridiales bacterium]MCC8065667.1 glycosyl hydrolase 115 family protein [Clostridiales bacterium]